MVQPPIIGGDRGNWGQKLIDWVLDQTSASASQGDVTALETRTGTVLQSDGSFVDAEVMDAVVREGGPTGPEWTALATEVRPWLDVFTASGYIGAATHGFGACDPANEVAAENTLYLYPLYFADGFMATEIGVSVATAGAGGTIARLGLFTPQTVAGTTMDLLLDAGTVTTASTGSKTIAISQAVPAGWVWVGIVCSGSPTLSFIASPQGFSSISVNGAPNCARRNPFHGAGAAAFGSTETPSFPTTRFPHVWLRRA